MASRMARSATWIKLQQLRRIRRLQSALTFVLVIMGPLLALATYSVLGPLDQGARSRAVQFVLMADLVYVLVIIAVVVQRILKIITQRRQKSSGSKLHLRLTRFFTLMALIPTITVAVFATVSINMGFEAWFSDRVQNVIGVSLSAAKAYEVEQKDALRQDVLAMAEQLFEQKNIDGLYEPENIRITLERTQTELQRGLKKAFVIDSTGRLLLRGARSYKFDLIAPRAQELYDAVQSVIFIEDYENNELRALYYLSGFSDHYLYVTRDVNGALLTLLDQTQQTALLYQQLESERGKYLFNFGLFYLALAVLLIMSSVLLGLWFAERLSRPIGRLAGAAQRVGEGHLDTQVVEEEGDDEIALLSVYFNQMTRQLKSQRRTLLNNTAQIEERRRLFDSVLSSVTSGVLGLDADGQISFANRSAERLLDLRTADTDMIDLRAAVPEFSELFDRLTSTGFDSVQDEIRMIRGAALENLLVRMSKMHGDDGVLQGYVVAFDDVTDLVSAQRSAAWGDVARRIAHEIKNPLTPISLSAERIKRKFTPQLTKDQDILEQLTDVIVRQTNDLRRIVDEFSKFARMPEPDKRSENITQILRQAVTLQESGQPEVTFVTDIPAEDVTITADATMMNQALTNLMKNAGEAIGSRFEKGVLPEVGGKITVRLLVQDLIVRIQICDNGIGLPQDRSRLFEPYVTHRDKGTGLGLPIVKKIIEEHGGTLRLEEAPTCSETGLCGACATIELPTTHTKTDTPKREISHD